jgi:acetate kinase
MFGSTIGETILVLNAGSSSIKFSLFAESGALAPELVLHGQVEGLYTRAKFAAKDASGARIGGKDWGEGATLDHDGAVTFLFDWLQQQLGASERVKAVGHRVVHGGTEFSTPTRIDTQVVARLEKLVPLAPLHQPHNLALIKILLARSPELPQVACFDTAFHRNQLDVAQSFALPAQYAESGVRRYGFHGLSYEYIAAVLPQFDPRAAAGRTVALHLGNGASMCAIHAGKSIATTMGFTALDGLPMGTRCGAIDPGVLLYLINERGMNAHAIENLLYHQSGLLGVSGLSSDMRTLEASNEPRAKAAIDLFVYRIGRELGSLAAALGGLDAIVFTAGIGENSVLIRERVCRDSAWLGVALDAEANRSGGPRIGRAGSRVSAWVIPTNEELMIARHTRATRRPVPLKSHNE